MKSWRERISEARQRGEFDYDDHRAWGNPQTCLVGEQREKYGLMFSLQMDKVAHDLSERIHLASHPSELQMRMCTALNSNDFDGMEKILDYVEDQALALKRSYFTQEA